MNGTNSNTSGADVANINYWPKGLLDSVVNHVDAIRTSLKDLLDGETSTLGVDFAPKAGSDKIEDSVMDEVVRRLVVTTEKETPGNVIFQPNEPTDHTKAWWQTDAVTGLPIGRLKQWDEATATWVVVDTDDDTYTPPEKRFFKMNTPAGTSTQTANFADIKTTDYKVTLTPTTGSVFDTSFGAAPASFPNSFGYAVIGKTNTSISIAFYGIPTETITWEVDIEDRETTA